MLSNEERRKQNKWIRALSEPLAGVETDRPCVTVGDIHGDGDYKLVVIDFKKTPSRLVLFQGLSPVSETQIFDPPTGVVTVVCETENNKSQCVAVSAGGSVLIYRNMKPYYKFTVPQLYLHPAEVELWERCMHSEEFPVKQLFSGLQQVLKEVGLVGVTEHTQQLMAQKTEEAKAEFVARVRQGREQLTLSNVRLTCIATIKRNQQKEEAVDVLVVGAELGSVYWIDAQAFTILDSIKIHQPPVRMLTLGLYEIESRTFVVTRDSDVVILRKVGRAAVTQNIFYLRSPTINLIYSINQLVFATRDRRILFYSARGKCLNELRMNDDIADIDTFYYEPRQYQGILIAVNTDVLLYVEMFLVDRIRMEERIEWIRYGRMGREEGVLLIGLESGGISAKIFRRTALLGERADVIGAPLAQSRKLPLPRRTKAFVDQSLRERENPLRLHRVYQRDLFMLKYQTAKTFAALQSGQTGLMPSREVEPIDFNLDLLGFGPVFQLTVNVSATRQIPMAKRVLTFVYDSDEYSVSRKLIHLPSLMPSGVQMSLFTHVTCLRPENQTPGELRIVMIREGWKQPIFAATVQMPISEQEID
ncbi:Bardet-Biedl syndrome 1 protein [Aphelenchoides besseyi]|nr:Bardet-Biedl syndrome 1 protein [Aphelenchoides besseyi]